MKSRCGVNARLGKLTKDSRPIDAFQKGIHDVPVRTTLDINDALLRELREIARSTRRPFRVVLEEALHRGLSARALNSRHKRIRITPHPVGIKPALHAMSMNQLYDKIEAKTGLGSR